MSGIAGVLYAGGRPLDRKVLDQMVGSLAHRGPDGSGAWTEGAVGLGHRMLHTTPESLSEKLPLVRGNLSITADARIDNREELMKTLGLSPDYSEGEISDSELILGAYERWGERCPERLLGDFAFAVWDKQRRMLFCARDHMGVKPFYYYYCPGELFAFGSEINALLCVDEVPRRLNETRVADYLTESLEDKEITFYRGILRLPPAHTMTIGGRGTTSVRTYWALDPTREIRLGSDEEYAEAFKEIFTEAVRCRLRSAFPVGSELSGGLDSSSVVCVARDLLAEEGKDRRLHTFSAVFPEVRESDESAYIYAVWAQQGLEPHELRGDLLSPLIGSKPVLWGGDEPSILAALSMAWALCSSAHQHKVRVLFSGQDGDTVVSHGDPYLMELALERRWWTLATEIDALSRVVRRSPRSLRARIGIFRRAVIEPLTPEPMHHAWRRLSGRNQPSWPQSTANLLSEDFARWVGLAERTQAQAAAEVPSGQVSYSRKLHWQALLAGMIPTVFELEDKIGATFSVEVRYPFYDTRLVEFCLALPPEQKLHRGWGRMVLRRAMAGILPEEIRWRTTKGRPGDAAAWSLLMRDRKLLEETILEDTRSIEQYVDIDNLRRTYYRYLTSGEPKVADIIVRVMALALWLRREKASSLAD
jgi:asparagine synthase (glutamine-hydrolysing)